MTGYQKRNLRRSIAIGLVATTLVAAAAAMGLLTPLERRMSDQRAAWCQFKVPPPTDQLIHLDIDDNALEDIHRWPWPRGHWAMVLDELRLAGARTVGFDVLFTEPQQDAAEVQDADPLESDDVRFARAIAAHGRVILPATFSLTPDVPTHRHLVDELVRSPGKLASWDAYQSTVARTDGHDASPAPATRDDYLIARRRALFELICDRLLQARSAKASFTLQDARAAWFPAIDPALTDSPQMRLLERQYTRALAYVMILHSGRIHAAPQSAVEASDVTPPVSSLAWAIAGSGFVDVVPDADGVVRYVPAVVRHDGDVFPQLGLALAQLHRAGNHIPTLAFRDGRDPLTFLGEAGPDIPCDGQGRLLIPWTGPVQDWQGVVGHDKHLAVGYVWEAARLARSIHTNRLSADQAINDLYRLALDPAKAATIDPAAPAFADDAARLARIDAVLAELQSLGYPDALQQAGQGELKPEEKAILAAIAAIRAVRDQQEHLTTRLAQRRADLASRLDDKAVLVGYTASGLGDIITTPLHTRCPGVIAHGAIFNGVMTGGFWSDAKWFIWLPVVILMGMAGTALAVWLSPGVSAPAVMAAMLAYALANGLLVFDRWNVQLPLAPPMLAAGAAWAACTFLALLLERRERARITRRFQNYVDPTLVSYVIENPDKARLEGEARTMSVVFTDLEGFTKLSSAIHERVVPVINRYLEEMIPPIHAHRGYVNKFLGDGIMFFFGAPRESARHAQDAVAAIMDMQERMAPFNESLQAEGLPPLRMRAGMTTGRMIVGDAGSGQRSDYTVMGDQVNLAARLESANKACGTSILINDAAAELVQDQYLLRPVGRLQVVGRSQAVMCFEPMVPLSQAGHPLKKMVELTHRMIQAYTERRWDDCLAQADELARLDETSAKLAELYRQNVAAHRGKADDAFDGRIELASK